MGNIKFEKRSNDKTVNYIDLKSASAGDVLINGDKFVGTKEFTSKSGKSWTNYLFESDQGEVNSISATGQLKYLMSDRGSDVQVGERVLLNYEGRAAVNGIPNVHQFSLLVGTDED